MAASTAQAPSKSSKKKAAKAIERTESPAPSTTSGAADKNGDEGFSTPYIKELQKNIRNLNKKIANASKTDSLLEQHKGKSLDELVNEKILNNDQKAQILKKPALQAQLAQSEEQLTQYQQVHEQYQKQAAADKATSDKALATAKSEAFADAKADFDKAQRANLLLVSQFLRLAAYRREEGADPEADENQAIEGVLMAIYAGDDSAVDSMLKLVEGSSDSILSVVGEQVQSTYATVKAIAQEYKSPFDTEAAAEPQAAREIGTDPTVAHATAGEMEAADAPAVNGHSVESITSSIANVQVADNAANSVAESHWDSQNDAALSQEWVQVPRDPKETDTGLNATPAANANTQSWADDHPEQTETAPAASAAPAVPADPNDGFHQVQRNRNRNEGGNNQRGRGRGEYRGRGGRGDGRGRGRGNRGGAGRGPRRVEES